MSRKQKITKLIAKKPAAPAVNLIKSLNELTDKELHERAKTVLPAVKKPELILFGDSSIDNNSYVTVGEDVATLVQRFLPDVHVVKQAQDGAIIDSVQNQLDSEYRNGFQANQSAVLSVGGNDAVKLIRKLTDDEPSSFLDCMVDLTSWVLKFGLRYNKLIQSLRPKYKHLALCTIYKPDFEDRALQQVAVTLLPCFNQVIRDAARATNCTLIDNFAMLKTEHITWNIEPSERGSRVIAGAIASVAKEQLCPKSLPA